MSLIGQTIKDTYQVYEEIGQGAAATVYMARDLSRNRVVALKAIHPHLTKEGRFLERFRLEAELLSKVKSPHIVQIYDFGKEDDVNYIVMEYLEGKTLSNIIQERGPLDVSKVLYITRQIAECLSAMSAAGIVHRDIKPANIMFTPEGQVKIMDFGIAKGLVETGLTQTGVLGTPHYISPEQAEGARKLDVRSDIYSAGIVLFEMLTGRVPYEETSPVAVIMKHLTAPIPPIHELREDVPEEVEDLMRKCLAKLPERRFQTPQELIEAIDLIQPPEVQPVTSMAASEAVLQQVQQLTATLDELHERVTSIESQPPGPAPVAEAKWFSLQRAGLIFLAAFVLLAGFFGIMLPRPPSGEVAPADLDAQIAAEVERQVEAVPTALPPSGEVTPADLEAQIAAEVERQVEAVPTALPPSGEVTPADLEAQIAAEVERQVEARLTDLPAASVSSEEVCFELIAALQSLGYSHCVYVSSPDTGRVRWYTTEDCSGSGTEEPSPGQKQSISNVEIDPEYPVYVKAKWETWLPYLIHMPYVTCTRNP